MLEQHAKEFWSNLPNLPEPLSVSRGDSAEVVVLLPIWRSHVGWRDVEFLRDVYAHGGAWARHSFLRNTDAVEHGVAVKFWIDATLEQELRPTLERNHIDWDKDVFAADIEALAPVKTIPGGGQHLLPLVDPQLAAYDRLLMLNTDVLTVAVSDKIRVFEALSNQSVTEKRRFLYAFNTHDFNNDPLPREFGTLANSPNESIEFGMDEASVKERESIAAWCNAGNWEEARAQLVGAGMSEYLQYDARSVSGRLNGCISVWPARDLRENRPELLDDIYNAAMSLGNDQLIFQCVELKQRNQVENIMDVLGMDEEAILYLHQPDPSRSIEARHRKKQNYFTHHPVFPSVSLPDCFWEAIGFNESQIAARNPRKNVLKPVSSDTKEIVQHVRDVTHRNAGANSDSWDVVLHSHEELYILYDVAKGVYDTTPVQGNIVQCGTYKAGTACLLALAAQSSGSKNPVVTIDTFFYAREPDTANDVLLQHWQNIKDLQLHEHILSVCGDTVTFLDAWNQPIRLIVFDSGHTYEQVSAEIKAATPNINFNGGWMVFHDHTEEAPGVMQAVSEFLSECICAYTRVQEDAFLFVNFNESTPRRRTVLKPRGGYPPWA